MGKRAYEMKKKREHRKWKRKYIINRVSRGNKRKRKWDDRKGACKK